MVRTIIVTIAGMVLSLLFASLAIYLILNHTEVGHLMAGDVGGITDPWNTFMSKSWIVLFCVSVPTITLVAVLVGVLTKKYAPIAAGAAVLPISVISSGLTLRGAWISVGLVFCSILLTALTRRLARLYDKKFRGPLPLPGCR